MGMDNDAVAQRELFDPEVHPEIDERQWGQAMCVYCNFKGKQAEVLKHARKFHNQEVPVLMPLVSLNMDNAAAIEREEYEVIDLIADLGRDLTAEFIGLQVTALTLSQIQAWLMGRLRELGMEELFEYIRLDIP